MGTDGLGQKVALWKTEASIVRSWCHKGHYNIQTASNDKSYLRFEISNFNYLHIRVKCRELLELYFVRSLGGFPSC